eukprot:SAG31_NODE_13276_length_880_cov_1.180538_1_plen_155_part_01
MSADSDDYIDSSDDEFADVVWFEPGAESPAARPEHAGKVAGGSRKAPPLDVSFSDVGPDQESQTGYASSTAKSAVPLESPSTICIAAADVLEEQQKQELDLKNQQLAIALRRRYTSLRPLFRAVFCKFDADSNGFIDGDVFEGLMMTLFGASDDT